MSEETTQVRKENKFFELFGSFGLPRLIAVFFFFAGIDVILLRKSGTEAAVSWQAFIEAIPVYVLIIRTVITFAILTLARFLLRKTKTPDLLDSAALISISDWVFSLSALSLQLTRHQELIRLL